MIKTPLSTMIGGAFWTPGATILGSTSATLDTIIKSLFANSEQGFAYDPNDLTTLYQDAAGNIPVTAAGQPVGLMLDKSKGLVLGAELVVDGGFDDATKWIKETGWSVSGGNGIATNVIGNMQQGIPSVVGRTYLISGTVLSRSTGSVRLLADGTDVPIVTTSIPRVFSYIVRASLATIKIGFRSIDGFTGTVDNVSVRELSGNHAYQTVSASRPILQRNATTGAYYLAFDGADDFLQTNNIDFTATDKVSLFAGVRKLSDVALGMLVELSADSGVNNGSFRIGAPASPGQNYSFFNKGSIERGVIPTGFASPISNVLSASGNISADITRSKVNGANWLSSNLDLGVGNYGNYPLYIGRRAGTSFPFNGNIYSLIGIGRLTTDTETLAIEKAIAKNVGVTLSV